MPPESARPRAIHRYRRSAVVLAAATLALGFVNLGLYSVVRGNEALIVQLEEELVGRELEADFRQGSAAPRPGPVAPPSSSQLLIPATLKCAGSDLTGPDPGPEIVCAALRRPALTL